MTFRELDVVALAQDLPEHGLKRGDLGAIVHLYPPRSIEVEFVTAAGATRSVLTLDEGSVRATDRHDLLAVRKVDAA